MEAARSSETLLYPQVRHSTPSETQQQSARLYGVTFWKIVIFIATSVRISSRAELGIAATAACSYRAQTETREGRMNS
jgi:hypothetical protein